MFTGDPFRKIGSPLLGSSRLPWSRNRTDVGGGPLEEETVRMRRAHFHEARPRFVQPPEMWEGADARAVALLGEQAPGEAGGVDLGGTERVGWLVAHDRVARQIEQP